MSLLVDPDPRVVAACRRQIHSWGGAAVTELRRAAESGDARLRLRARAILRGVKLESWVDGIRRFANAMNRAPLAAHRDHRVLQTGALMISGLDRVCGVDHALIDRSLDEHADHMREFLRGRPRTAVRAARALREHLGGREGHESKHTDQYDLRVSLIDEVVKARRGTAISLVILYLLVGRRTGMCVTAVGLPDHVLVRVHGARSVLVDPARGGRNVTNVDCLRGVRERGYTGAVSSCMRELGDREVLLCLLDSLRRVYGYREDAEVLHAIHRARALLMGDGASR